MPTNPSKRGPGFHHVAIRAFDFDKTLAFYADGIGAIRKYGWGDAPSRAAMLDLGDGNYMEVFEGRAAGDIPTEGAILHFALRVQSCDQAYARALAAGATSKMEPKNLDVKGDTAVTVRIAFISGLDGEVIELFENDVL